MHNVTHSSVKSHYRSYVRALVAAYILTPRKVPGPPAESATTKLNVCECRRVRMGCWGGPKKPLILICDLIKLRGQGQRYTEMLLTPRQWVRAEWGSIWWNFFAFWKSSGGEHKIYVDFKFKKISFLLKNLKYSTEIEKISSLKKDWKMGHYSKKKWSILLCFMSRITL